MGTSHSEVSDIELRSTTANMSDASHSEISDVELHSTNGKWILHIAKYLELNFTVPLLTSQILRIAKYLTLNFTAPMVDGYFT